MKNQSLAFLAKLVLYFFLTNALADTHDVCTACHGPKGISTNPSWLNLAGQNKTYLKKQLLDMQKGVTRQPSTMAGILSALSNEDIDDLGSYYATMPAIRGSTSKKNTLRGEQLYKSGDSTKRLIGCIACHGPKGTGSADAGFPHIAGQHASYIIAQLNAFKNGTRTNDLSHIMRNIAINMSDDDINEVAQYIEDLN